ncbi:MAG: hypothetical protein JWP69_464 [Flaviaesturariibacter sp.]|nr:hypothetical protein [Flaviaesturariibacter sp.]
MYKGRPKLKLQPRPLDRLLNRLALAGLLFSWGYTLFHYSNLPQIIPIHYNLSGEVDGYGNKMIIWLLPSILTLVFGGISWISRYPELFNYPQTITPENAGRHYRAGTRVLSWVNLVIVFLLFYITYKIIQGAYRGNAPLEWWFVPLLIILLMAPSIGFWVSLRKSSSKDQDTGK